MLICSQIWQLMLEHKVVGRTEILIDEAVYSRQAVALRFWRREEGPDSAGHGAARNRGHKGQYSLVTESATEKIPPRLRTICFGGLARRSFSECGARVKR